MIVTDMPRASVLMDGRIQMDLKGPDGSVVLDFTPDRFEQFLSKTMEIIHSARSKRLGSADHHAIRSLVPVEAAAHSPVGGGRVIVSFVLANHIPYRFALPLEMSRQLRELLRTAEVQAERDAKATRQ